MEEKLSEATRPERSRRESASGGKNNKQDYLATVGRRKESIARVRLYQKKGDFFINNKKAFDYFKDKILQIQLEEPFKITNTLNKFALTVKVSGGGQKGQLEAVIHALSRALAKLDQKNRQILKKKGFLTRDARVRQRRNVGMGGKARRKKQSPKR